MNAEQLLIEIVLLRQKLAAIESDIVALQLRAGAVLIVKQKLTDAYHAQHDVTSKVRECERILDRDH